MRKRILRELGLLAVADPLAHEMQPEAQVTAPPSASADVVPISIPADDLPAIANMDWQALRESVHECRRCALCKQRKQAVFGVGSESARWLFVGEGPGAEEDEQGEPFVGQAGKLLDNMLAAIGIRRGREVYIANVVKCRPPGNRTPSLEEAAACAPYLDRQIALIKPRLIVALGKTAATRLLGSEASLASLRGRMHSCRGIPVVVTYHPAYLLRSLPEKSKSWEDLLLARRALARQADPA